MSFICRERARNFARSAGRQMNVAALEHATGNVGTVRRTTFQLGDRRRLVPERFEEGIGKGLRIKRLRSEFRYSFFNFNGVHICPAPTCAAFPE
jgi:hypothetical protein